MPDPDPTTTPPADPPADPPPPPNGDGEPTDAEGWRKYVARINRESAGRRKELEQLQNKLNEFEQAGKSETQKEREAREVAERRVTELETENMRIKVGLQLSLPADLVDRLRGSSEEEMLEDGKTLLKLVRPDGDLAAGRGGGTPAPAETSMNDLLRGASGRR